MPSGLLVVTGTLNTLQFWPKGSSDADTAKIVIDVDPNAFRHRPDSSSPLTVTHVFDTAWVRGSRGERNQAVKNGKVTIRFQGIDAPELHYRPVAAIPSKQQTEAQRAAWKKWSHEYRQPLGEGASAALGARVEAVGPGPLSCRVETQVDSPDEVFDTYGRFVGDVLLPSESGADLNLNQWLVEQGWALPTFYASMTAEEIETLAALADQARAAKRGVWKQYRPTARAADFDWDMIYRRPPGVQPDPVADLGKVRRLVLPKLYRRLCTWSVNHKARLNKGTFHAYLEEQKSDTLHLKKDFLEQGPTAALVYRLAEIVDKDGKLTAGPGDLVFRERASTLLDANGKKITTW